MNSSPHERLSFEDPYSNEMLDYEIDMVEVYHVFKAIENNKSAGSDGIVGEFVKYGAGAMCEMLLTLHNSAWKF